ncbi:MAG: hypothetical protein AAB225_09810 [Acidobacteriota bacterium]
MRFGIYIGLAAGAIGVALLARGILQGRGNNLLTRLVQSGAAIAPRWGIRPSVELVSLRRNHAGCTYFVAAASPVLSFTDPRAARLSARSLDLCLASKGARISVTDGLLGDVNHTDLLRARVLDFDQATGQAGIRGAHWRLGAGEILATVAGAVVSPGAGLGKATAVDVLPRPESSLARIRESQVAGVVFREGKLAIRSAVVEGVDARLIETAGRWNFEQALPQLQSGARELSEIARRTAAAVRRTLRGIRSDLWVAFWVAAVVVFFLKLAVTGSPLPWRWRVALALAPVLLGYALGVWLPAGRSLAGRMLIVLFCSTVMAIVLWGLFYRRAPEWRQRCEPAVVVLLAPCLLALILFAHAWISGLPVPELPQPGSVSIAAAEARAVNALIRTSSCGEAATANILSATLTSLEARIRPGSFDLESLSWGEAAAKGLVSSPLLNDLRDIRYLPPDWRSAPSLSFCVSATTDGRAAPPEACEPPAAAHSVRVAVVLDPAGFDSHVHLQDVAFRARGNANLGSVRIHQLRSAPGSRLAVESGSGVLTAGPNLDAAIHLRGIQASEGSSSVRIASAELRARLPRPCEAGRIEAEGLLSSLAVALPDGYGVQAASVNLKATRAGSVGLSLLARSTGTSVRGERPGETGPWLVADLPSASLEVTGIPVAGRSFRRLDGKAEIVLSGAAGPVLGLSRPIEFTADLRRGEFTVHEQRAALRQSVTSRLGPSLDVQLSAHAAVESLRPLRAVVNSAINVSSLSPRLDPFALELKGLSAQITGTPGEPLRAGFRSGTNTLYLPSLPPGLEIDRIDRVHLASQGRAVTVPSFDAVRADLRAIDDWRRRALPRVPEPVQFHLAGDWQQNGPVTFTAATPSGASISGSLESRVRRLLLPGGRFGLLEADSLARKLRTGRHGGDLHVSVRSKVTDDGVEASLLGETAAGLSPAASLNLTQDQLEFKLLRPLDLSGLVARTNPFLKEAGVDLDGIDPQAGVLSLDAKASFQRSELRNHTIALRLRQGPLATIDFRRLLGPNEPRFLRSAILALNADSDLTFEGGTGNAHASADVRGLRVNVNDGAETATLFAAVRQPFVAASRVSSIDPAWRRQVSDAGEGLRHHLMRAADILGNGNGFSDIKNLRWDFTLDNRDGLPLLQWERDRLRLAFQSNWRHLSATIAGGARPFVLRGSLAPDIVLSSHLDHVVADAAASADLAVSVSGGPERKWKGELPLHIAVNSRLRPAPGESPHLWDTKFYESFWSAYRPVHAPRPVSLIDRPEVLAGGFALREIRFPSGPLQLALGFEGPLQLHFPFQGRALFGDAGGLFQARLKWGENDASVDAFARVGFRDLEAGAFGRAVGSGPQPIIEDKMEGTFDLRTAGFRFRPALVDALRVDASRVSELDKVSFSLALNSAPQGRPLPGVFQAHVDVGLMPRDEGLRELFDAIRRLTPRASPLRYDTLSVRLDVSDGLVNTRSPLLHLRGIDVRGPLPVQGDLRVLWGRTPGFADRQARLRNLVYSLQRTFLDSPGQ